MRIIGGQSKRRRIKVSKKGIRPTKGIIRGAIFNIIGERVHDARVLDIFAGSGALGLEAVSRGAKSCVFIEKRPKILFQNIEDFSVVDKTKVIAGDFRSGLKKIGSMQFDIIFMDPPYSKNYVEKTLTLIIKHQLLRKEGVIVAEHYYEEEFILPNSLFIFKKKCYNETVVSFMAKNGANESSNYPKQKGVV